VLILLWAVAAAGEDRLAVLEFFGRPHGAFCSAAGPAMISLQSEMRGRALLLEYDFDAFPSGRVDRFWATGVPAQYLPLVMVGCGYRTSSGSVNYEPVYRNMINDELARPPQAAVTAYWRRVGNGMRVYAQVTNTGTRNLTEAEETAIWLISWENARIGVSGTWVRKTAQHRLTGVLNPGETATAVITTSPLHFVDWDRIACLAMVEHRPGGTGRYDMLQAAEAVPAGFTAVPDQLVMNSRQRVAEVALEGPHVLAWTASSSVPWLEPSPASGTGPATVTVTLLPDLRPSTAVTGSVSFEAAGDGMAFTETVDVTVGMTVRRPARRVVPD